MEEENRKMSTMEKILFGTGATTVIAGLSIGGFGLYKCLYNSIHQNTAEFPNELFAVPATMAVIAACQIGVIYYEIKHNKINDNH